MNEIIVLDEPELRVDGEHILRTQLQNVRDVVERLHIFAEILPRPSDGAGRAEQVVVHVDRRGHGSARVVVHLGVEVGAVCGLVKRRARDERDEELPLLGGESVERGTCRASAGVAEKLRTEEL